MNQLRAIVVVGFGLVGFTCVVFAHPRFGRADLARRLTPYLATHGPGRTVNWRDPVEMTGLRGLLQPVFEKWGRALARVIGDDGRDLPERLEAAASPLGVSAFRAEQVTWMLVGFVMGIAASMLMAATGRPPSPVAALILAVAAGVLGLVARDRQLTRAITSRRARALAELPTVVDVACIAVTAGESLRGSLQMVATDGAGPLAGELRTALRLARGGMPLVDTLRDRARRIGLPAFDRFVDAIAIAQDRGIPLADSLRAMAFDERERAKRELIEAAGRKQVSMLVPVVALILPVAILFAFYPGIVAIRTLAN